MPRNLRRKLTHCAGHIGGWRAPDPRTGPDETMEMALQSHFQTNKGRLASNLHIHNRRQVPAMKAEYGHARTQY
jgi:hypothetical protein